MKKSFFIHFLLAKLVFGILFSSHTCLAYQSFPDTAKAEALVRKAMDLHLQVEYDSSIACLQQAKEIFLKGERWERYVHCLNIIGDCYLRKFSFTPMKTVLLKARSIEKQKLEPDNLECALTHSLLGILNIYQGKFANAVKYILAGKKIRENQLGIDNKYVAASNYLLGIANLSKGNLDEALEPLNEALRIYELINDEDHFNLSISLSGIGYVYFLRSDFDIALRYLTRAYSLINTGDKKYSPAVADCEKYLGWIYLEKGDLKEATLHLTTAMNLYIKLFGKDNSVLVSCYSKLGITYAGQGDYDKAIEMLEKTKTLVKRNSGSKHLFIAFTDRDLGMIYAQKKDLNNAFQFSQRSLALQQKISGTQNPELSYTYELLGSIYSMRGKYPIALTQYQKAIGLRLKLKESNDRNDIANLYSEIGALYAHMNKLDSSLAYYNKALVLHNHLLEPNRPQRAAILKGIGDTYTQRNEFLPALKYYQQSINALLPEFSDTAIYSNPKHTDVTAGKDLIGILSAKGVALEKSYLSKTSKISDLKAALETYKCAEEVMDMLRKNLSLEGSKFFLEEKNYSLYQNAIRISTRLFDLTKDHQYLEKAFTFTENSKANVLLDGLNDSNAKQFAGISDSLIEKERALKIELAYYKTQLQKEKSHNHAKNKVMIAGLENKCFDLDNKEQQLTAILEKEYPHYFELKYKQQSTSVSEVQKAIDERTCVIEYAIGEDDIAVFTITKSSFRTSLIKKPKGFENLVTTFYKSIKTFEGPEYIKSSLLLYKTLLSPIKTEFSNKDHLLIIPDGYLYYVPFEALIVKPPTHWSRSEDFSQLDYLIKSFEISYSYSCTFYLNRIRGSNSGQDNIQSFAGFAPVFSDVDSNSSLLATNANKLEEDSSALRSITVDGKKFGELKYSEREVASAAERFHKKGKQAVSFLHNDATEENFKKNVGKYSCIHIATHGYINEEHPQLSLLLFSQHQDSRSNEDGILYASEMYNLNLKADLLVLSSCESGVGKFIKGEGMIAMTRGLFYSGARNIIFSLWRVYDKQTDELMSEFYRNVLNGASFASSLRQAKLSMIANPSTAGPAKWSGFILLGK